MTSSFRIGLMAAAFALASQSAQAHALLESAAPPVGGSVANSPSQIRLTFSEEVVPQFSGAQLVAEAGAAIPLGRPSVDPADRKTLVVPIGRELAAGRYKVSWRAVSVDTHRTEGSFSFTVGR